MTDPREARRNRLRGRFLRGLREHGIVAQAAREAGASRRLVYHWRAHDEAFAARWDKALALGLEALEDEAMARARDGAERTVWYQGKPVGTERRPSDALLIFLLRNRLPDRYGWYPGGKAALWARDARGRDGGEDEHDEQTPEQRDRRMDELLVKMGLVAVPLEVAQAAHAQNPFRAGLSGASLDALIHAGQSP